MTKRQLIKQMNEKDVYTILNNDLIYELETVTRKELTEEDKNDIVSIVIHDLAAWVQSNPTHKHTKEEITKAVEEIKNKYIKETIKFMKDNGLRL